VEGGKHRLCGWMVRKEALCAGDARAARNGRSWPQTVEPVMKEIDQRHACEKRKRVGQVHQGPARGPQGPATRTVVVGDKRETEEEAMPMAALAAPASARPTYSISETVMVSRKKEMICRAATLQQARSRDRA